MLAKKKKKKKTSLLKRLETIFFWLTVGGIIFLVALLFARLANKPPQLPKRLNDKENDQYELQKNYLISTTSLANNLAIHSFFNDLLITYAEKFARSKKIDISTVNI